MKATAIHNDRSHERPRGFCSRSIMVTVNMMVEIRRMLFCAFHDIRNFPQKSSTIVLMIVRIKFAMIIVCGIEMTYQPPTP